MIRLENQSDHRRTERGKAFRFGLRGLFVVVTLCAIYMMLIRNIGLWVVVAIIVLAVTGALLHHVQDRKRLKHMKRDEPDLAE